MDYKTAYKGYSGNTVFALAEEANNVIKFYRSIERSRYTGKPRPKNFVIEAFRNPYEVEFFRNRYYEFYLCSLFADIVTRQSREGFSLARDERDQGKGQAVGGFYEQNVSECVRLSDIALNNEGNKKDLWDKLLQYYALIKHPGIYAPTWTETAMHMAYSVSVRSTCISRQVGAVIEGANGYILGAGWNDVGSGQVGCGYRQYKDLQNLNNELLVVHPQGESEFKRWLTRLGINETDSFCFKDKYSEYIIRRKLKKIEKTLPKKAGKLSIDEKKVLFERLQNELNVKMMQYCRALHAEENAILQTTIIGGIGIKGGTIYTTTFPCELCAKKIYQSGIKKVVFTEPYPKSISQDVFFQDGTRNIQLDQFEGVKSQSYFRLYKATIDKKEFQGLESMGT